jgi:membrane-bound lytic murein transglycosylase D
MQLIFNHTFLKYTLVFLLLFRMHLSNAQSNNQKIDSAQDQRVGFSSLFKLTSTGKKDKPFKFELNPKAVSFIQSYMDKQGPELIKMKTWGRPYFNLYDEILTANGIPVELKYLSVIESHLTPNLVSTAGAVGPWQLMPYEATRFGLKLTPTDERTDFAKSTKVAATLLKELYAQFGDWLLVVAAYNGGPGRVSRALQKKGTKSFWDIEYDLPLETRNHVKKFIATHYVFEEDGGWTTLTKAETNDKKGKTSIPTDNLQQTSVSGRFLIAVIAQYLKISAKDLSVLNPQFDQTVAAGKSYSLKLPKDKLEIFEAHKNEILQASLASLYSIKE